MTRARIGVPSRVAGLSFQLRSARRALSSNPNPRGSAIAASSASPCTPTTARNTSLTTRLFLMLHLSANKGNLWLPHGSCPA